MRGGVRYLCHKSLDNIAQKVQEQALIKNHEEIESFVQAFTEQSEQLADEVNHWLVSLD
jgi:hypothetical protein